MTTRSPAAWDDAASENVPGHIAAQAESARPVVTVLAVVVVGLVLLPVVGAFGRWAAGVLVGAWS